MRTSFGVIIAIVTCLGAALIVIALTSPGPRAATKNGPDQVQYVRDERTGLCFAMIHKDPDAPEWNRDWAGVVQVECSSMVNELAGRRH